MLFREDAAAEHMPGTWLQRVLRQEPGCQFRGGFPDHRVQAGVETRELRPQPHQPNPAVELSHTLVLSVSYKSSSLRETARTRALAALVRTPQQASILTASRCTLLPLTLREGGSP